MLLGMTCLSILEAVVKQQRYCNQKALPVWQPSHSVAG